MLIKDRFTVIGAPLDRVRKGYQLWTTSLSQRDVNLPAIERGMFSSFAEAWRAFGEIVDKGGVLFAAYSDHTTYGFSQWIGLVPLAKWCDTKAMSIEVDDERDSYTRLLSLQEGERFTRGIELRYNRVEGWYFHESGDRYPFEDGKKLSRKIRRERFDKSDIEAFLSMFGARLVDQDTFADVNRFLLFQHGTDKYHRQRALPTWSPEERQRLLSLTPIHQGKSEIAPRKAAPEVAVLERPPHRCPHHVADSFKPIQDWKDWGLAEARDNPELSVGEIVCSCGSKQFRVTCEGMNVITKAHCARCRQTILLYDLKQYPGTTLLRETTPSLEYLAGEHGAGVNVAVGYEYPDESFEPDDDVNAIAWFKLWCREAPSEKVREVFDHETA